MSLVRLLVWDGNIELVSDNFADVAIMRVLDTGSLQVTPRNNGVAIVVNIGYTIAYEERNNGGCWVIYGKERVQ